MKEFVLITGLSGAGKSQAAGILEDMGFFCVDNLPAELVDGFVELVMAAEGKYDRVVLVSDIRGRRDIGELARHMQELREKLPIQILFLEASDRIIVNRYKETRHSHPLDRKGSDLPGAIRRERTVLAPLRDVADHVVDTSGLNWSSLKLTLSAFVQPEDRNGAFLHICSFGYKNGLPAGADLVMDVRFLPNPFYVEGMRELTGLDAPVREYVCSTPAAGEFLRKMTDLITFLLPKYRDEGKSGLLIAIGCTGGRHRSVAIAEELMEMLRGQGYPADCVHRELR